MTLSRLMIVSASDMFLDRVVLVEAVEPSRTDAASTDATRDFVDTVLEDAASSLGGTSGVGDRGFSGRGF